MTKPRSEASTPARILIIDDDPQLRALIMHILRRAGYQDLVEAENGDVAIQLATVLPFDLVITDLVMPEVEGLELIRWFQQSQPAAKVIAVSGAFHGSFLSTAQLLGAAAVVYKPFSTDALLTTVRNVLSSNAG